MCSSDDRCDHICFCLDLTFHIQSLLLLFNFHGYCSHTAQFFHLFQNFRCDIFQKFQPFFRILKICSQCCCIWKSYIITAWDSCRHSIFIDSCIYFHFYRADLIFRHFSCICCAQCYTYRFRAAKCRNYVIL